PSQMIAYRPCYAGSRAQPLPWRRVGQVGSRLKRRAPLCSEPSENSSKLLDVDVLIVPHLYAVRQTQFLGNPGGRVQSKRSSPTPAAPRPAAPQPAAERASAPPCPEGAQAACRRCARLGAQKFPWPASCWEPRGPEGKKDPIERYARRLAAQAPANQTAYSSYSVRLRCGR